MIHKLPYRVGTSMVTIAALTTPFFGSAAISNICTIFTVFIDIVKYAGTAILIVAILMLLYAAFLFITGGGNEDKIKQARSILIFALIGLAVALLATSADDIIKGLFSGESFLTGCSSTI